MLFTHDIVKFTSCTTRPFAKSEVPIPRAVKNFLTSSITNPSIHRNFHICSPRIPVSSAIDILKDNWQPKILKSWQIMLHLHKNSANCGSPDNSVLNWNLQNFQLVCTWLYNLAISGLQTGPTLIVKYSEEDFRDRHPLKHRSFVVIYWCWWSPELHSKPFIIDRTLKCIYYPPPPHWSWYQPSYFRLVSHAFGFRIAIQSVLAQDGRLSHHVHINFPRPHHLLCYLFPACISSSRNSNCPQATANS